MKIRPAILWTSAVVIAVLLVLIWLAKRPAKTTIETSQIPKQESQGQISNTDTNKSAPVSQAASGTTGEPPAVVSSGPPRQARAERWQTMQSQINHSLVFYGKLEDQFGNPVAAAEITGNVTVYDGYAGTHEKMTTISDAQGRFKLDGGRGQMLGIVPRKPGYALASLNGHIDNSSEEAGSSSNPNNPVIIKMWKLQGTEPLLKINQSYKVRYTNAPLNFDFLTGKIVSAGGDIRITVNRPPGIISLKNPQEWSITIEAVDGGLMPSGGTEGVTYYAPESGYEVSKTIRSSDRLPEGGMGGFHIGFYIMSRNGQVYSKLGLSFRINPSPSDFMSFTFDGIANTTGSRNWEGDPNTNKP